MRSALRFKRKRNRSLCSSSLYPKPEHPPPAFKIAIACAKLKTELVDIESSILRVGIVGSGIAGLTAAYLLERDGHDVTLFERQDALGMSAHGLDMTLRDASNEVAVKGDIPSRMFNDLLWPNLAALYREIGVEVEEVNPTQSLSDSTGKTYLIFSKSYRPQLDASLIFNSRSRKILTGVQKLFAAAKTDLKNGNFADQTFEEYLQAGGYSDELKFGYLYPTLSSTVCTCSYAALAHYPALLIFNALDRLSGESPLLKTVHGTRDVVNRLSKSISELSLSTNVQNVTCQDSEVAVSLQNLGRNSEQTFDHLVVATQANQALHLVDTLSAEERQMLECFKYEDIPVVVHTDPSLMPMERRRWTTFNMISDDKHAAMCSVWMIQFHKDWQTNVDLFQSIGPLRSPAEESIQAVAKLQRPVVNDRSKSGWRLLKELNGQKRRNLWFCGSYASKGIPLLESGVQSAMEVCRHINEAATQGETYCI